MVYPRSGDRLINPNTEDAGEIIQFNCAVAILRDRHLAISTIAVLVSLYINQSL